MYPALHNILQSKNAKRVEPMEKGQELGLKRTGKGKFGPSISSNQTANFNLNGIAVREIKFLKSLTTFICTQT